MNSHHTMVVMALQGSPSNRPSNSNPESTVLPCFFPFTNGSWQPSSCSSPHAMCFLQHPTAPSQSSSNRRQQNGNQDKKTAIVNDRPNPFLMNVRSRCTLKLSRTCWLLFSLTPQATRLSRSYHHPSQPELMGLIWNFIEYQPPIDETHRSCNKHSLPSWTTTKATVETYHHNERYGRQPTADDNLFTQ